MSQLFIRRMPKMRAIPQLTYIKSNYIAPVKVFISKYLHVSSRSFMRVYSCYWDELSKKAFLELFRPKLHFSSLQRVVSSFPVMPDHAIMGSFGWKFSMTVRTVYIRIETTLVLPSSFILLGTVFVPVVVILVSGWKRVTSVITQRIPSCSYRQIATQLLVNAVQSVIMMWKVRKLR